MDVREHHREGHAGGEKAERGVLGDLAVDHRHVLVRARGLIEPRVQVLEQPARDLSIAIQFVDRPQQKRLVQHCGQQRVGHLVTGHVHDRDPRFVLATLEVVGDVETPFLTGAFDPRVQIETLLEVDVGDVIAADRPIERH